MRLNYHTWKKVLVTNMSNHIWDNYHTCGKLLLTRLNYHTQNKILLINISNKQLYMRQIVTYDIEVS